MLAWEIYSSLCNETLYNPYGSAAPNMNYIGHESSILLLLGCFDQTWHLLKEGSTSEALGLFQHLPSPLLVPIMKEIKPFCVFKVYFILAVFFCVLLVVFCFGRRDSSVIKEEIKAFLANRRISQAVVAQVTGKSPRSPFFILGNCVWTAYLCTAQMLEYCLAFCIAVQICQLSHDNVCLWFRTHCPAHHGTSPVNHFYFFCVCVACASRFYFTALQ